MTARSAAWVIAALLLTAPAVRAETVDWSQYIEKKPAAQPAAKPAPTKAKAAATTRPARTVAAKPKAKAPAKARRKHR